MPRDYEDELDSGGTEVEALHRFLTDPVAQKTLFAFVAAYYNSLEDDDEDMDAAEHPEMSRNDRVLALTGIFELLEDLLGGLDEEDEEYEGDDEVAKLLKTQKRRRELAKDKRMSTFYKAFMGDMKDLTGPWHSNRAKFLAAWGELGNRLYAKSPSKEDRTKIKLIIKKDEATEEAAIIGSEAALPTKVLRAITELGFKPVSQPLSGDAAWVKRGTADGYPDRQVYLIRREEGSYLVLLSKDSKYDTYGKPLSRQLLDDGASDNQILSAVSYMYDSLAQE
jgi:hypothetical protein